MRRVRARSNVGLSPASRLLSCWSVSPQHKASQQHNPRAALSPEWSCLLQIGHWGCWLLIGGKRFSAEQEPVENLAHFSEKGEKRHALF